MPISTASLRALPPKQALVLAMAEKARRLRIHAAREESGRIATSQPETAQFADVPSLVLDRSHPLSDLYYKKARNKVYWGGRGSAKSWAIAEALVRLAAALPLRILCTREFQVSIADSSHKLLKDTISRLKLDSWFTITDRSIKSRVGAEFIFKGLHNNEQGIRSVEGIDICWVEEAQSVTALSWQSLTPTMRKAGSEMWVSFNLIDENDATYKRFVAAPPADRNSTVCVPARSNSIVHKLNYYNNPYFPDELREEMENDRELDYELYEHIWEGMPRRRSNAIVLNGKYRVEEFDDDLWKQADTLLFGADFGFATDPSTLSRMFILPASVRKAGEKGNDLYISHEAYGYHIEFEDYPEFYSGKVGPDAEKRGYAGVPDAENWPIKADAAAPATISAIRRRGFAISAAEKWQGSVEDGIRYLRSFNQIVIHPRCVKHAAEAFLWRYKVDPKRVDDHGQPLVLPVLVDAHNHTWDGVRYGLDGRITRTGAGGVWARLGERPQGSAVATLG